MIPVPPFTQPLPLISKLKVPLPLQSALDEERHRVDELQVGLAEAESERDALSRRLADHDRLAAHAAHLEERNNALEKVRVRLRESRQI